MGNIDNEFFNSFLKNAADYAAELFSIDNEIVEMVRDLDSIESSAAKNEMSLSLLKNEISNNVVNDSQYKNDKQRNVAIIDLFHSDDRYKYLIKEMESIKSAKLLKEAEIKKFEIKKRFNEKMFRISLLRGEWIIAYKNGESK